MNRLVVVSNRVPVPTGGAQAGGLSVALEGLMAHRGGLWFGWSGKVTETPARDPKCVHHGAIDFATIDLTPTQHARYYNEYANAVLWPLLHSMPIQLSAAKRSAARTYREVNQRFAEALIPQLRPTDMVWVHDYHLMPLPGILRARGVCAPIGFFLHIPFPAPDMLATLSEAHELIRDLLAADLIGFQTRNDLQHFAEAAVQLAGALRSSADTLVVNGRRVRLGVFPVEIESEHFAAMAELASQTAATQRLRGSLGEQKLILGIDRLDPTKGIPERIAGYRHFLETTPQAHRRVAMLQIAPVSREAVEAYRVLRQRVERDVGALNAEFSEADWTPLRLVTKADGREALAGFMRQARVGLVTPLRDGMNLVAKEFIAAQNPDDPGVLVLSRFAGAAEQLSGAILVNPHDPDEIADAIGQALRMDLHERQARWRQCWQAIHARSGESWGKSFLAALLRCHDQFSRALPHIVLPDATKPISLPSGRPVLASTEPTQAITGVPGVMTSVLPHTGKTKRLMQPKTH